MRKVRFRLTGVSAGNIADGNNFSVVCSSVRLPVLQADDPKPEELPRNYWECHSLAAN
jgi:hypothetical protein